MVSKQRNASDGTWGTDLPPRFELEQLRRDNGTSSVIVSHETGRLQTGLSTKLLEAGVRQFRLFQDGNIGVGSLPSGEKILILCSGFSYIALHGMGSGHLKTN